MPTKQETFDTVVDHLRQQGRKATSDFGCAYRGAGGCKCAVGCLIPDELYDEGFETFGLWSDHSAERTHVGKVVEGLGHDLSLCCDLQDTHDECDVQGWESEFSSLALKHDLIYTPPTN